VQKEGTRMAESDTILQLGIDAAREGNREEARNLFGLLTRQEPDNLQAWLWLAGVADGPEERRAALERVLELDPTNEMASKGLQTMGGESAARPAERETAAAPAAAAPSAAPAREMSDEERFAAELDMAFDDYDALPKTEAPPRPEPDLELEAGASRASARAETARRASSRTTARRGATTPVRSGGGDDDMRASRDTGGLRRILLALAGIAGVLLVLILIFQWLNRPGPAVTNIDGAGGTGAPTATSSYPAPGGVAGGDVLTPTSELAPTGELTSTGELTPTGELTSTGELTPTGELPPQPAPAGPVTDANLSAANPQPAGIGTLLQANGWGYTYPSETYAAALGSQVGQFTATGNWVLVLVHVANNSGTDQPLPPDYFILKDAQGNIYRPQPQVSSAYVQRGVNADISMEDSVPANSAITSIPLLFDVKPGATNLVLFASRNPGQGWQVLESVP
jgi:hypothetical protein